MADAVRCICKKEKPTGGFWITSTMTVEWGDHDPREDWTGLKEFCSFACQQTWAGEKAANWDPKEEKDDREEVGTVA